jgi:hypothetical protein
MPQLTCLTPLGEVTVSEEAGAIVAVDWGRGRDQDRTPLLSDAVRQLQDYFDGHRADFDLPLQPYGSGFQQQVWACAPLNPARRDPLLWRHRAPARLLAAGHRPRQWQQPDSDLHPLPPRHRGKWRAGRLFRRGRTGYEALAAGP